jgi:deoxyinosine 3'endonuclease (endonuclease V)
LKYGDAIRLQNEIAEKVVAYDDFDKIERVCGVDVAYDGDTAYCSAVVMEKSKVVESVDAKSKATHPYIPGLLMLREAEPIFHTVNMLKNDYDLLLVDGHGQLHPRKCGLACYVGVTLDKPAVGVAKSRLCGTVRPDSFIELGREVLGYMLGKCYVSVGHRVSLKTAIEILKLGTEPLKLADINSKVQKRGKGHLA